MYEYSYGDMVDFSFIVSLYVSDLPNITISTRTVRSSHHLLLMMMRAAPLYSYSYSYSYLRLGAAVCCTRLAPSWLYLRMKFLRVLVRVLYLNCADITKQTSFCSAPVLYEYAIAGPRGRPDSSSYCTVVLLYCSLYRSPGLAALVAILLAGHALICLLGSSPLLAVG